MRTWALIVLGLLCATICQAQSLVNCATLQTCNTNPCHTTISVPTGTTNGETEVLVLGAVSLAGGPPDSGGVFHVIQGQIAAPNACAVMIAWHCASSEPASYIIQGSDNTAGLQSVQLCTFSGVSCPASNLGWDASSKNTGGPGGGTALSANALIASTTDLLITAFSNFISLSATPAGQTIDANNTNSGGICAIYMGHRTVGTGNVVAQTATASSSSTWAAANGLLFVGGPTRGAEIWPFP